MTYAELQKLTDGKKLPLCAKNDDGENVIIEHRIDHWSYGEQEWERPYYLLTTAQNNGWTRINHIYADGSMDELYQRGN